MHETSVLDNRCFERSTEDVAHEIANLHKYYIVHLILADSLANRHKNFYLKTALYVNFTYEQLYFTYLNILLHAWLILAKPKRCLLPTNEENHILFPCVRHFNSITYIRLL